jgi:hypothetical protein
MDPARMFGVRAASLKAIAKTIRLLKTREQGTGNRE